MFVTIYLTPISKTGPRYFSGRVTPGGCLGSGIDSAYSLSWENSFSGQPRGVLGRKKIF